MSLITGKISSPIGVFDSGVGGLTVLKELRARFPHEDFIYFADTANCPYGTKSKEEVTHLSRKIIQWFEQDMKVKMAVAGCNTSSALALESIVQEFHTPIIGTVIPTVNAVLGNPKSQRIGIIATLATTNSGYYPRLLRQSGFLGHIESIACPLFVPMIEAMDSKIEPIASLYLKPFIDLQLDTLIYGCTHYPLIAPIIETLIPSTVIKINPAQPIALQVRHLLESYQYRRENHVGGVRFFTSGDPLAFEQQACSILGHRVVVEHHHIPSSITS